MRNLIKFFGVSVRLVKFLVYIKIGVGDFILVFVVLY